MKDYTFPVGLSMTLLGVFLCLFGHGLLQAAIFVLTVVVVSSGVAKACFSLGEAITHNSTSETMAWMILLGSFLVGICVGSYMMHCLHLGMAVVAACAGASLGTLLNDAFNVQSLATWWIVLLTCILAAIAVTVYFKDTMIIVCTSFMGSYVLVRGVTLLIGGYPDPFSR